jgi:acetylornithine deacetylase/succinyl-diaminopimelate desuccinylase-like protein
VILGRVGEDAKRPLPAYGHYDVQPSGENWKVDPFAAEVVGNSIIGRVTCDMKDNLMV